MMVLPGLLQGCLGRTLLARPSGKPERRPSEMHVFAARIISPLAMLMALGAHTLPAAAQDESPDFPMSDRMAQINASPGSSDVAGTRLDTTQDGMLAPLKANSLASVGHSFILTRLPLQEGGSPKTTPISSLKGEMQNESLNVGWSGSPVQNLASKPNHGLHFPLLKQATIASILVDLRKKFGPESMMQSGNFHWFFDSQRLLATGDKSPSLVACSKMSQWSSICASTNASNFSVYIKGS
jgi:hypothetical protein